MRFGVHDATAGDLRAGGLRRGISPDRRVRCRRADDRTQVLQEQIGDLADERSRAAAGAGFRTHPRAAKHGVGETCRQLRFKFYPPRNLVFESEPTVRKVGDKRTRVFSKSN